MQATMKGFRPCAPKKLLDNLKRFFAVIVIDEDMSSQLCPCCHKKLSRVGSRYRLWKCTHGCKMNFKQRITKEKDKFKEGIGPLIVNKDVSAGVNFFYIFVMTMATGERPLEFVSKKTCGKNQSH
jgi:hypothetical protein